MGRSGLGDVPGEQFTDLLRVSDEDEVEVERREERGSGVLRSSKSPLTSRDSSPPLKPRVDFPKRSSSLPSEKTTVSFERRTRSKSDGETRERRLAARTAPNEVLLLAEGIRGVLEVISLVRKTLCRPNDRVGRGRPGSAAFG